MIAWMTRASYLDTARDLDDDTLVRSAEHALALIKALDDEGDYSPAIEGWQPAQLATYYLALAAEGGYRSIILPDQRDAAALAARTEFPAHPPWVGDTDVLSSHRSNLARRWSQYSKLCGKTISADWPYIWPFVDAKGGYELKVSRHDRELLASGARSLPKSVAARVVNL